jgi:hypothetical protein
LGWWWQGVLRWLVVVLMDIISNIKTVIIYFALVTLTLRRMIVIA